MLEIKLVNLADKLYTGTVHLATKSLHRRDRKAIEKYHKRHVEADRTENAAQALLTHADNLRSTAEQVLGIKQREITSALNFVTYRKADLDAMSTDSAEIALADVKFLKNLPEANDE